MTKRIGIFIGLKVLEIFWVGVFLVSIFYFANFIGNLGWQFIDKGYVKMGVVFTTFIGFLFIGLFVSIGNLFLLFCPLIWEATSKWLKSNWKKAGEMLLVLVAVLFLFSGCGPQGRERNIFFEEIGDYRVTIEQYISVGDTTYREIKFLDVQDDGEGYATKDGWVVYSEYKPLPPEEIEFNVCTRLILAQFERNSYSHFFGEWRGEPDPYSQCKYVKREEILATKERQKDEAMTIYLTSIRPQIVFLDEVQKEDRHEN